MPIFLDPSLKMLRFCKNEEKFLYVLLKYFNIKHNCSELCTKVSDILWTWGIGKDWRRGRIGEEKG